MLNNQNQAGALQQNAQSAADKATAAYNQVGQQVGNLGSESGRFNLLQQSVKNPQYTQGQQRLDQLFLQTSNPNQLAQNQRDLGKQAQASAQGLTNQYNDLGQQIQQAGVQAQDVSKMLGNTLNTEQQNLTNAQIAEAQAKNTSNAAANTALQTYFTNGYGSLTADQKALIDPILASQNLTSGTRTFNVLNNGAYNNYLNQGSTNLTGADVLDQNEFNRYNALAQLAGNTNPLYTQAGTGGTAAGIQGQKLMSDIQAAQNDFIRGLNTSVTSVKNPYTGQMTGTSTLQNLYNDPGAAYRSMLQGVNYSHGNLYGGGMSNDAVSAWYNAINSDLQSKLNNYLSSQGYNTGLGGITPTGKVVIPDNSGNV